MKKIIIALVTFFSIDWGYKASSQVYSGVSFNTFYTELSPYGSWISYPGYGEVWISNINGFEPYSNNGHWEFTSYGWTWVSDYPWGWAPFHYGRWAYLTGYGWAWIPGYEWAPAWVSWCEYDGFYGWAPLGPGWAFNRPFRDIPYGYWHFVRHRYINSPNVYRHFSRPAINSSEYNNVPIVSNVQVVDNTRYAAGPSRQEVEKNTRKTIAPKTLRFAEQQPGKSQVKGDQVQIYRPEGDAAANAGQAGSPVKDRQPAGTKPGKNGSLGETGVAELPVPVKKQPASISPVSPVRPDPNNVAGQPGKQQQGQPETLPLKKPDRVKDLPPVQPAEDRDALFQQQQAEQQRLQQQQAQQAEQARQQQLLERQRAREEQQRLRQEQNRRDAEARQQQQQLQREQRTQQPSREMTPREQPATQRTLNPPARSRQKG